MSNYAILHVDKIKSHQVLVQRSNHNFRKIISDNVNPEMIMYNRQLIGDAGSSYEKLFQVAVKASPYYNTHNVAKNAVLACEILLSIPHEVKDNIDLDKWCDANIEWLNERFGKDNVKNAVLHLDEEPPPQTVRKLLFFKGFR